ncbi:MAG TPA: PspA/IM30 family protein [Stellaceae bacterium]|nr:PspA/IM30 family protein [Stellaceae bacterium]
MTDTIAARVTRIIGGGVHAFLDRLENAAPDAVMAQAVREIDQLIGDVRAELGRAEAAKHLVTTRLNRLNTEHEELAGQIEIALGENREDLARAGVEKQLNIEDQIPVLQKSLLEQQENIKELEGYIAALFAKKREMEQALQEFLAARRGGSTAPAAANPGSREARAERAGAAFDRVLARHGGVAAGNASAANAAQLKELQELQHNRRIDDKLATLKAARQPRG